VITKDSEKAALIRRLSDQGISLMVFYDDAPPASISHDTVNSYTWLVHAPYEYEQLEKWLYPGNWQAIHPGNPSYRPFNSFKTKTAELDALLREAGIKLLIDSFHDDIEWNVIEEA